MSKATEEKLSVLHGTVATVLTAQVGYQEELVDYDKDGEAIPTGETKYTVQPATLAAAIKFLKDNQITCDAEVDDNMNNLKEALSRKQRHSRLAAAGEAALKAV